MNFIIILFGYRDRSVPKMITLSPGTHSWDNMICIFSLITKQEVSLGYSSACLKKAMTCDRNSLNNRLIRADIFFPQQLISRGAPSVPAVQQL
ncbi:MAG: hypothetical protein KJN62_08185, partial [Deltaproteobacteria bacterium]|nr:hypothetical protein [Deltaproteobacteria bacterium]